MTIGVKRIGVKRIGVNCISGPHDERGDSIPAGNIFPVPSAGSEAVERKACLRVNRPIGGIGAELPRRARERYTLDMGAPSGKPRNLGPRAGSAPVPIMTISPDGS